MKTAPRQAPHQSKALPKPLPVAGGVTDGEAHRVRMAAMKAEQDAKVRAADVRRGILIVNTGDGKGKSTAAFGMVLRTLGYNRRVGVIQFIKGKWKTGEMNFLSGHPLVEHVVSGDGFTWETQDRAQDIRSAERGWAVAKEMLAARDGDKPRYGLVVFDELNVAMNYGYLDSREIVATLLARHPQQNVVVTGRNAPQQIIDAADTVTIMALKSTLSRQASGHKRASTFEPWSGVHGYRLGRR